MRVLTRDFNETIQARVKRDPGFRKALLREGIENFISGYVETGSFRFSARERLGECGTSDYSR